MIGLFGWLVTDIRNLRSEVRADIGALRGDVTALRERMAGMEALMLQSSASEEFGGP